MPDLADLFPGFASEWIGTRGGRIFARIGGKGPPLLPEENPQATADALSTFFSEQT